VFTGVAVTNLMSHLAARPFIRRPLIRLMSCLLWFEYGFTRVPCLLGVFFFWLLVTARAVLEIIMSVLLFMIYECTRDIRQWLQESFPGNSQGALKVGDINAMLIESNFSILLWAPLI